MKAAATDVSSQCSARSHLQSRQPVDHQRQYEGEPMSNMECCRERRFAYLEIALCPGAATVVKVEEEAVDV